MEMWSSHDYILIVLTSTAQAREGEEALDQSEQDESLLDLISGFGQTEEKKGKAAGVKEEAKKSGKGKGGQK